LCHAEGRFLGIPFALLGLAPGFILGCKACLVALMVASLASFVVYVPLTVLALNGGAALIDDEQAPSLTLGGYLALLALWTVTAWAGAVVASRL
jgi:hypothetical protein